MHTHPPAGSKKNMDLYIPHPNNAVSNVLVNAPFRAVHPRNRFSERIDLRISDCGAPQ